MSNLITCFTIGIAICHNITSQVHYLFYLCNISNILQIGFHVSTHCVIRQVIVLFRQTIVLSSQVIVLFVTLLCYIMSLCYIITWFRIQIKHTK